MVSRVIDVVLLKTVTAIFSLHAGARIGGAIPSSPAKGLNLYRLGQYDPGPPNFREFP